MLYVCSSMFIIVYAYRRIRMLCVGSNTCMLNMLLGSFCMLHVGSNTCMLYMLKEHLYVIM